MGHLLWFGDGGMRRGNKPRERTPADSQQETEYCQQPELTWKQILPRASTRNATLLTLDFNVRP